MPIEKDYLETIKERKKKSRVYKKFQLTGLMIAQLLNDEVHKSLYIKLAKTVHRSILEKALSFVSDSNADNKGALFMWKLKQLKDEAKKNEKKVAEKTETNVSV